MKKTLSTSAGKDMVKMESSYTTGGNVQRCSHFENQPHNIQKVELPYDLAIPLLGINPREMRPISKQKPCTQMFRAALFTKAKVGNNPSIHQMANE